MKGKNGHRFLDRNNNQHFTDTQPCRTTLGMSALPTPIAIELKCIAVVPEAR